MSELSSKLKSVIFWALTASISLIVFGVFVIDIFVIDAHGNDKLSIIFSYLSTVFAFLSALALFATIGVYFFQKNDSKKSKKEAAQSIVNIFNEAVILNNGFIDSIEKNKGEIIFRMKEASDVSPVTETDISFMLTTNNTDYTHLYKLTSNNLSAILPTIYDIDYSLFKQINYYIISISIGNNKTKTSLYSKRNPIDKIHNIQEGLTSFSGNQEKIMNAIRDIGYVI